MKTITGRIIKISFNKRDRTYTIKTESGKYRTTPMSAYEFEDCQHNTGQDWQQYLDSGLDYYKI